MLSRSLWPTDILRRTEDEPGDAEPADKATEEGLDNEPPI